MTNDDEAARKLRGGDAVTLQENIVEWRFSQDSVVKTTIGSWSKWVLEWAIIGLPAVALVYFITTLFGFSVGEIPHVPTTVQSKVGAGIILMLSGWVYEFRCLLTAGMTSADEGEEPEEEGSE